MKLATTVCALLLLIMATPNTQAANLISLSPTAGTLKLECNRGGCNSYSYTAKWQLRNRGPNHICQVRYTLNNWQNYSTLNAQFASFSGNVENWQVKINAGRGNTLRYVIICEDFDKNIRVVESNGTTRTTRGFKLQSPMQSIAIPN